MTEATTDPESLAGQLKGSPREFGWDAITGYVAKIIISVAGINYLVQFLQGNKVSCLTPKFRGDFFNVYCAPGVPKAQYFPAFMTIHAILILIPHALWTNNFSNSLEFFFTQVRKLDLSRNIYTGRHCKDDYVVIKKILNIFSLHGQNEMYLMYMASAVGQIVIILAGMILTIFYFTDFNDVFLCPMKKDSYSELKFWPFKGPIRCVSNTLNLFAAIRLLDLILLAVLLLFKFWSLIWFSASHPSVLDAKNIALFSFQSGLNSKEYKFDAEQTRKIQGLCGTILQWLSLSIPLCGSGPHISSNMDFLMLKLYRTNKGLAYLLRDMFIFSMIRDSNQYDMHLIKAHKIEQDTEELEEGDIIGSGDKKKKDDIKWKFTKAKNRAGVYKQPNVPLNEEDALILPNSIRGAVLSFASLTVAREASVFINFGSFSAGIPCALARIFKKVIVLNFNPHYRKQEKQEKFYHSETFLNQIKCFSYSKCIFATHESHLNDFHQSLKQLCHILTIDLIVMSPVHKCLSLTSASLCLNELLKCAHLKGKFRNTKLLTISPKCIGRRETTTDYFEYIPPQIYFRNINKPIEPQTESDNLEWPPKVLDRNITDRKTTNSYEPSFCVGGTQCKFKFGLYKISEEGPMATKEDQIPVVISEDTGIEEEPRSISYAMEMEEDRTFEIAEESTDFHIQMPEESLAEGAMPETTPPELRIRKKIVESHKEIAELTYKTKQGKHTSEDGSKKNKDWPNDDDNDEGGMWTNWIY